MSIDSGVNWGKLVAQNRVKAPGIQWTAEEDHAIRVLGISPDDVRAGVLTLEGKKEVDNSPDKPMYRMTKPELAGIARELGLEFIEAEVTKDDLIGEIEKIRKEQEKVAAAEAKAAKKAEKEGKK